MGPRIAIVVLTWGRSRLAWSCFSSLVASTAAGFRLYWVQNEAGLDRDGPHGFDALEKWLADDAVDHHIIANDENVGFPAGVNQGVAAALDDGGFDYIDLINSDVEVPARWHERLVAQMPPRCAAIGPLADRGGFQQATNAQWGGVGTWDPGDTWRAYDKRLPTPHPKWFSPARELAYFCTVFPAWAWEEVGLLDTRFGFGYGEDNDHSHRLILAGYEVGVGPCVCVHHARGATSGLHGDARWAIGRRHKAILDAKWAPGHPPEGYPPDPALVPWEPGESSP